MQPICAGIVPAFLIAGLCISSGSAEDWSTAEGSCFAKNAMLLQAGTGFLMDGGPIGVSANFEYGFHDAISGGGGLAFSGYHTDYSWGTFHYSTLFIAGRACFHPFNLAVLADKIPVRDKVDVYVGTSVGVIIYMSSFDNAPGFPDDPQIDAQGTHAQIWGLVGARYYFSPQFAVYLEEGSGYGWLNGGIAFKF